MITREDRFEELMDNPGKNREQELVKAFLLLTVKMMDAVIDDHPKQVAADFDEYRRRARDDHQDVFYTRFFGTLSDTIKRYHST